MAEVRLIDANALNEHKFLSPQVKVIGGRHSGKLKDQIIDAYQKGWNDCIDAIIDNAPTVEPEITNDDIKIAIKQGYNDGYEMARAKFERPKGEWIARIDETHYCSNCRGDAIDGDFDEILTDFCPHCGVQMVGGAE